MNPSIKTFLVLFGIFLIAGVVFMRVEPKGELVLFLDRSHTPFLDIFFKYLTFLGDGIWFVPLTLVFLFIRYFHAAAFTVLGFVQLLLIQGLKRGVFGNTPRPVEFFKDIHELQVVDGIDQHHFYSFPSGHTATAFGIAIMLILLLRLNRTIASIIFFVALLVGISRIYLGLHFLEDVLMGSVLGIFSAYLVWYIFSSLGRDRKESRFFNSSLREFLH